MATPINSNSNQTPNSTATSADMLARLQANAQGESASSGAFNAWMEKHALTPDKLKAVDTQAPKAQTAESAPRDNSSTAARLLEQALVRSRQQAAAAARQAEGNAQAASKGNAQPKAKVDGAAAKSKDDASASKTEDDEDSPTKAAATQEGSAIVSELTPPPEVKTDDSAAMMAWLASLTHGDALHGKKAAPKAAGGGSEQADSTRSGTNALDAARTDDQATSQTKALGTVNDVANLHTQPTATALLQAEGSPSFKEELGKQRSADPLGSLPGGMSLRAAPGWQAGDAANGVPHETATLQPPVGSDAFAQALSDQLTMWVKTSADNGPMTAELHLNPAELGPIHVKISLDGSDAQVDFAAAAVETRQAIEASMNTLSTALSDVGIQLTGGDVSSQTSQQSFQQAFDQSGGAGQGNASSRPTGPDRQGDPTVPARMVAAPRPGRAGGLDLYA
jgi:flagellar hook-length control protein FliK